MIDDTIYEYGTIHCRSPLAHGAGWRESTFLAHTRARMSMDGRMTKNKERVRGVLPCGMRTHPQYDTIMLLMPGRPRSMAPRRARQLAHAPTRAPVAAAQVTADSAVE